MIKLSTCLGFIVSVLGLIVFTRWIPQETVTSFGLPVSMKPATALSFLSLGLVIVILSQWNTIKSHIVASVLSFFPAALMCLYLGDALGGYQLGTKHIFPWPTSEISNIPSIGTMLLFILLGFAGYAASMPKYPKWKVSLPSYLAILTGIVAIVGYLIDTPILYWAVPDKSAAMSIQTSLAFILCGMGFLSSTNVQTD